MQKLTFNCRGEIAQAGRHSNAEDREDASAKELGFEDEDEQAEPEGEA